MRIEIGERNDLLYLLLPHHRKMALLSAASRERLERINRRFNGAGVLAVEARRDSGTASR